MHEIIDTCVGGLETAEGDDWREALRLFNKFMETLRSRQFFTDDRIASFQSDVDDFMDLWHRLSGHGGVGNYMHLLDVGHVADQLRRHRNLYR